MEMTQPQPELSEATASVSPQKLLSTSSRSNASQPQSPSLHPAMDEENASPYKAMSEPGDFTKPPRDMQQSAEAEMIKANEQNSELVMACYIAVGAIGGALVRMLLAQLFGEECNNPGTIGWLKASAPLCVTGQGETSQEDGIVFPDLVANIVGSFLMGFFASGSALGLALPLNIAWVPQNHFFQSMTIVHKAFTTGFCGSLTTFSSWNTAMVVMAFGTGGVNRQSQLLKALLGYIIGMETAIGSYICGNALARYCHKKVNPMLHYETKAQALRKEEGVHISSNLPDFERRFLPQLQMKMENYGETLPMDRVEMLEHWRVSTVGVRRVRHPEVSMLESIETQMLVELQQQVSPDLEHFARARGWDLDALQQWVLFRSGREMDRLPSVSTQSMTGVGVGAPINWKASPLFSLPVSAVLISCLMVALAFFLVVLRQDEKTTITYRTMSYSMLLAPLGAISRWQLSKLNGKLVAFPWFPAGTFAANILGSIVSILTVALEYRLEVQYGDFDFWTVGSIRAVRIGLAGCLTTVSTFVSEIVKFLKSNTNHAYPYMYWTLGTAAAISAFIYGLAVYSM